ncbi:hypothetical protein K0M31_017409 [Melipona bicolor]|uniref:Uncharacterized protein n=1 Tax=Melipona bicolor TaxID=60889 RepID=A0AA40KSE4_9HYME|nr:hypothetical protein K0M31_017409 [Melipona bicolor]
MTSFNVSVFKERILNRQSRMDASPHGRTKNPELEARLPKLKTRRGRTRRRRGKGGGGRDYAATWYRELKQQAGIYCRD